ncbi:MAG: RecQ family ATP-dependent DNA helicase [Dechloromonas sp.]|nr:RecQ family ATP-dependent DNA helicase [Dechloromonas sp.]
MAQPFAPKCLCLDIETAATDALTLHKFGAWRADSQQSVCVSGAQMAAALSRIDALTAGASFIVGHNIVRHDLPALAALYPALKLNTLPAVDTLELSPLAFPENPYHSLVKDYKLVRDTRNDPLKDAQLSFQLWSDQRAAFASLLEHSPGELACHHFFLSRQRRGGIGSFFAHLRHAMEPKAEEVCQWVTTLLVGKTCPQQLTSVLDSALVDEDYGRAFSYVLAWLRVSGGNSVLPTWVRLQYPATVRIIRQLRDTACAAPDCPYCSRYLDPRKELERYFNYPAFRPEPPNPQGGSLQEDIVRAGFAGESILAILPTGGGKSICYQLPALSRHWRNGTLTIVVSPLQSLMKDQVDNLIKVGVYSAATLNGMLTMPERRDVLDKVRLGDIGILLVSPEQFRNRAFIEAIRHRQIGAWVFDEAHCLSKWGNDFRPDYLYVSRFIRERYARSAEASVPVCCFTATAKQEVVDDIRSHFAESLSLQLRILDGGHKRDNLSYEVMPVTQAEKHALIHRLLEQAFGPAKTVDRKGGAVVFAARRKSAEEISGFLKDMGWPCAHFHAGLDAGLKKDIQQSFIAGDLKVIVATNAFGMGVDKPDVRIVIHAEIPGSLENYLQEAGRAGRDQQESRCVLLYDEEDVEAQFSLSARSRLSRQDIAGILRALRRYSAKTQNTEIVVTPGEILADDSLDTSIEAENPDADTKVRTAISWLERARFLERNENHIRVFPGSLKVGSLDDAEQRLKQANLPADSQRKYRELISLLINARDDEGISTDELMLALGIDSQAVIRLLHQLEQMGILSNDLSLTVLLRQGIADASNERCKRLIEFESALLDLLPELAPDADDREWQDINLRGLCQALKTRSGLELIPDQLLKLLHSLARSFGEDGKSRRAMFDVRVFRREILKIRLLRPWGNIREISDKRRAVAAVLLSSLLTRLDNKQRGVDLRVECKIGELAATLRKDLTVGPQLKDELTAIDAGLLYLHDNGVLILDRGKSVFRSAMTIQIYPEEKGRSFTTVDFEPLKAHYNERNFQIHVIHEYAKLGLKKFSDALNFVLAYFTLPKIEFIRHYFASRKEILERATTEESWQRIVEQLRHPLQQRLVAEKTDANRLILAGPGSGKTRVIVHRVAYLVRVLREAPGSILVLSFNRGAAREIRQRLQQLIGSDAGFVTVLTYHALALRLTGSTLAQLAGQEDAAQTQTTLEGMLEKATALLQGKLELSGNEENDALRERLLAGYRHILVDEYQDIDQRQYELIGALAGRQTQDKDARLTLLAVGDDDQNIYSFRDTSNEFIHRFQADYQARVDYLVENYRANRHLIGTANLLIAVNRERMKTEHPICINHARQDEAAGGHWQTLDPLAQGRVHILTVPADPMGQAAVAMAEMQRLKALAADSDWADFAILARNRATLAPIRAWCHREKIRYQLHASDDKNTPRFHQTREAHWLIDLLHNKPGRCLKPGTLPRWFGARFASRHQDNPYLAQLGLFIEELEAIWGDIGIPVSHALDELYDFSGDIGVREKGRLTLSTVHAAKGREFRHVLILDGGDWKAPSDDERRLYYVGMTRARQTLSLCQAETRPNPFSPTLAGPAILRSPLPQPLPDCSGLGRRYLSLSFSDVDIGFAGRQSADAPLHAALEQLDYGQPLTLVADGNAWRLFCPAQGLVVGRLAKQCTLPAGQFIEACVETVIRRHHHQSPPAYASRDRVNHWHVVLPRLAWAENDSVLPLQNLLTKALPDQTAGDEQPL